MKVATLCVFRGSCVFAQTNSLGTPTPSILYGKFSTSRINRGIRLSRMQSPGVVVLGVVVSRVLVIGILFSHRNHAAMRRLANFMLQLDGRVMDPKSRTEFFIDLAQDRVALGSGHVGDLYM